MPPVVVKGQIDPQESTVPEDYICRFSLFDDRLIIEQDEFGKDIAALFDIPLKDISEIKYLNQKEGQQSAFRQILSAISVLVVTITSGLAWFHHGEKEPDLLRLSFCHNAEQQQITMILLEGSASKFMRKYQKIAQVYGSWNE